MNYAIVSGAFKDVYSPIEACNMMRNLIPSNNQSVIIPFCDGGEYTYEILLSQGGYKEVVVENVINPYLQLKSAKYLVFRDEAHIVSSEILRLFPNEDDRKNPLKLSDFGYGQMVKHAIDNGYKKIFLYWGGTSTVCFGMGFAQALGVKLYDRNGELIREPITSENLLNISKIEDVVKRYDNIKVKIIADGNAKYYEMKKITELKIGSKHKKHTENILRVIEKGIENVVSLCKEVGDKSYSGAAGGLLFGTELCFSPQYYLGGSYFDKLLHISEKVSCSDCIITGEGRYDNSACGKAPVFISRIAKRYGKKTLFVCGQIKKDIFKDYGGGIIYGNKYEELTENGIDVMITCQEFYDDNPPPKSYEEQIKFFRDNTEIVLKRILEKVNM